MSFVSNSLLGDRLDAEYYSTEQIENQITIDKFGCTPLFELCNGINVGYTGELTSLYSNKGTPLYRVSDIKELSLCEDEINFVPKLFAKDNPQIWIKDNDIVLAAVGNTIGKVAIKSEHIADGVCSRALMIVRPELNKIDSYYLTAYLGCRFAQKALIRGISGSAQPVLNTPLIASLSIVDVCSSVQLYIGNKIRQAECLRAWAKELEQSIEKEFKFLVENKPKATKYSWTSATDLEPYRINPSHYDPTVLTILKNAQNKNITLEPISILVGNRKVAGGATPKGASYLEAGVLFGRVQNVKPLALDLSDAVFIDNETNEQLSRSECKVDDIVLSITGYPGTASLVTEQDLPMNINQHSVRFNIKDGLDSAYVCAALNSEFLKLQVQRLSIGGTRDALDFPSVGNLLIPRLNEETEKLISNSARNYIKSIQSSKSLVFSAKLLVEELIEGNVSEDEIVAAQKGLEAGDDSLERALLESITADGVESGGSSLFDDIDQLYNILAQADGAMQEA